MIVVRKPIPNGIFFLLDPDFGELPERWDGERSVLVTPSAVVIATLAEVDGETEICLGEHSDVPRDLGLVLRWDGEIETSGRLGIITVPYDVAFETVASKRTMLQIWTNDVSEPDLVWIAIVGSK